MTISNQNTRYAFLFGTLNRLIVPYVYLFTFARAKVNKAHIDLRTVH